MARGAELGQAKGMRVAGTLLAALGLGAAGCGNKNGAAAGDPFAGERARMVAEQLQRGDRGIRDGRVLAAMGAVPRHLFVPPAMTAHAYEDRPLPIGFDQTISQPFIVAFMTEQLRPGPGDRVLEVGTGSGYQAAILARLAKEVYTIEIVAALAERARTVLREQGAKNVQVRTGDGYRGWPEAAPFDGILVTCSPDHVPGPLVEQLAEGGRMIIPVGEFGDQHLVLLSKRGGQVMRERVLPVRFVPMTGEAESGGRREE